MRGISVFVLGFCLTGTASAHDFWLQPHNWQTAPGIPLPFVAEVGHGAARERWGADRSRLRALVDVSRAGSVDLRPLFRPGGDVPHLTRVFQREGLHVIGLVSTNSASDLPAIRFNDYLKEEGLTPAIAARAQAGTTNRNGRELYSRRAKALVQVGRRTPGDDAIATRPIGMTLEIVPLRNPYSLGTDHTLPVQILYNGRPVPGALVKLTSLEYDAKPLKTIRSDGKGRVSFKVPPTGSWLVNVVWTRPIASLDADFETVFSSLTFGYPARRTR